MAAGDYWELYANTVHPTDAVSAAMSPAFVNATMGLGLVYSEPFDPNTNVKKFRKSGSGTAQTVAEAANFTYGTTTEITDSSTSVTAAKKVFASKHSVESLKFGDAAATFDRYLGEHGGALGRLFDTDLKALFSSITNVVTATTTLTKDDVLEARYNIRSSTKGAFSGMLVSMLDFKGAYELDKVLTDTAAAAFNQQVPLGYIGVAKTNPAHYKGSLFGIDFYETDGLSTVSSDDIAAVWDPTLGFCAGVDTSGFQSESIFAGSQGVYFELTSWAFWKVALWNDTACSGLRSDT